MNFAEFSVQMDRLVNQFGKNAYSEERVKLIWRDINHMSAFWFQLFVDRAIGEMATAPLLPAIREAVARERERIARAERELEPEEDFKSSFSEDERHMMIQTIIGRVQGRVSDQHWEAFLKILPNEHS